MVQAGTQDLGGVVAAAQGGGIRAPDIRKILVGTIGYCYRPTLELHVTTTQLGEGM